MPLSCQHILKSVGIVYNIFPIYTSHAQLMFGNSVLGGWEIDTCIGPVDAIVL